MRWLREPHLRGRLALGLVALLALALVAPFVLGSDARHLSAYRGGAEDISDFRATLPTSAGAILATPAFLLDVEDPRGSLYVAVGAERAYGQSEALAVIDFLQRGGNVLLADEGGFGDRIAYEAGFAFDTNRLLDTNGYLGDKRFPVADARTREGGEAYRVVFNLPTKLKPLSHAGPHEILAASSPAAYPNGSYMDLNGNGQVEREDAPGPHALVARTQVKRGTLVLVADTGLFMNAQMRIPGADVQNEEYAQALVASLVGPEGRVYLDESRHAQPAPLAAWNDALRALGRATSGGLAPVVLLLGLALGTFVAWRSTRGTEDWSRHAFDLGHELPAPPEVRPDLSRLQRLARRRISEKFNIPLEQVAAMTAEELQAVTGDRTLAEAAAGTLRADPAPLFRQYAPTPSSSPEVQ